MNDVTIKELLDRQIPWSTTTFGEGKRTNGITEHITKELQEIKAAPDDLMEWVDVILLGLDGAWRAGYTADEVQRAIQAKQNYNLVRIWPKFEKGQHPDKAIEHVRESNQCQVRVAGNPFHCECGGNVFTKSTDVKFGLIYACNACFKEYVGESIGGCKAEHTIIINYCEKCRNWKKTDGLTHWLCVEFLRAGGIIDYDDSERNEHAVLTPGYLTSIWGCTCGVANYHTKYLTFRNEAKCCKCGELLKGIVQVPRRDFYCTKHYPL